MGVSTLLLALAYFTCSQIPGYSARVASHTAEGTSDLWLILERIQKHDGSEDVPNITRSPRKELQWKNGAMLMCQTGGGHEIGRGATLHYLHISELASWAQGESGHDSASVTGILNSVPKHNPRTFVAIESTGQGPVGEFYERCTKADEQGDDALVFLPWSSDGRYRLKVPKGFEPTEQEDVIQRLHHLDLAQLAWRRATLDDALGFRGDGARFRREFPLTLQEAFEAATGRVHPSFCREAHVGVVEENRSEPWVRYRAIDWGGRNPFVCLWLAVIPGEPGFSVDPGCENLIREFFAYRRDVRTGDPLDDGSHGPDCVRYALTTWSLYGRVHVYRELYAPRHAHGEMSILNLCERIHELTGWVDVVPHIWEPGKNAEFIAGTVADRTRPDSIQLFCQHGLHCGGQRNLVRSGAGHEQTTKSEREQGIDKVNELIAASVPVEQPRKPQTEVERKARELRRPSRMAAVSHEGLEGRLLKERARELMQVRGASVRRRHAHPDLGPGF